MPETQRIPPILRDYESQLDTYRDFTGNLEQLIVRLLRTEGIRPHSVTSRVKTLKSLEGKLKASTRMYDCLNDITDLAGVRVITYFADQAANVGRMIERNLDVDEAASGDKRVLLDPDRFGYLSLHYVVRVDAKRGRLAEWRSFSALKAEIQIRSILQHAWAEIEHDLGYKTKHATPLSVRRRFARLAGLLELADDEFRHLRDFLADYTKNLPDLIRRSPDDVGVDQASVSVLIKTSATVKRIDEELSAAYKTRLIPLTMTRCGVLSELLNEVDLRTVAQVESALKFMGEDIVAFKRKHFAMIEVYEAFFHGACLFVLCWIRLARKNDIQYIVRNLPAIMYPDKEQKIQEAERFLRIVRTLDGAATPDRDAAVDGSPRHAAM